MAVVAGVGVAVDVVYFCAGGGLGLVVVEFVVAVFAVGYAVALCFAEFFLSGFFPVGG